MSDILNARVDGWSHETANAMLAAMAKYGIYDTGRLYRFLRYKLNYDSGDVDRISFRIQRYGIFVEKGVGRGHKITDVKAAGASIANRRKPKPWFSEAIDPRLEKLADMVASAKANQVVNALPIDKVRTIGR